MGLSRVFITDRESEDRALRAMCWIVEETSNVDKLHTTREHFKVAHDHRAASKEIQKTHGSCVFVSPVRERAHILTQRSERTVPRSEKLRARHESLFEVT